MLCPGYVRVSPWHGPGSDRARPGNDAPKPPARPGFDPVTLCPRFRPVRIWPDAGRMMPGYGAVSLKPFRANGLRVPVVVSWWWCMPADVLPVVLADVLIP